MHEFYNKKQQETTRGEGYIFLKINKSDNALRND